MSESLIKAQNAVAIAAWDIVRCQNAVNDATAVLHRCRTNLSDAHKRHDELCEQYYVNTHESWRLAIVESHRPAK
jgi:hypothetical protein